MQANASLSVQTPAMNRRNFLSFAAALPALQTLSPRVYASANWPSRPIRIVVPVSPGGSIDLLARTIAKEVSPELAQPVVVENVAGAGGNIAFGQVARATPDGYTLLMGWDSLLINPALYPTVPYQVAQFAPITLAITSPQVLVVGPRLKVANLREFLAAGLRADGAVTLANAGNGSPGHLAATLLEQQSGVKFTHVPYKGGAPAVADLVAGHVDALMVTLPSALQHIRTGRLTALGVSSASRSSAIPDVPTLAQAGLAGYELDSWQGLLAPGATPEDVVGTLNRVVVAALRKPEIRQQLVEQGYEVVGSSPDTLGEQIRVLTPRWAQIVRASGAQPD